MFCFQGRNSADYINKSVNSTKKKSNSNPAVKFKQKQYKVFGTVEHYKLSLSVSEPNMNWSGRYWLVPLQVTHSLPQIPAASPGELQLPTRTTLNSRRSTRLDSEALPSRLTAYGLAALQERVIVVVFLILLS